MSKKCIKCDETKELSEFYKLKASVDEVGSYCKVCTKKINASNYKRNSKYWADYAKKNMDKILEYQRGYYALNSERVDRRAKRYYEKNKDKIRDTTNAWKLANPEADRAHTIYRNAVRKGEITPLLKCELTGESGKIDFHHEDYSDPLKGLFLSRRTHKRYHLGDEDVIKAVKDLYKEKFGE